MFYNKCNDSIIIVYVIEGDQYEQSSLKCKSISDIRDPTRHSQDLFKHFDLKWPDFIEFDEMNAKIITRHSAEGSFRIWDLTTYKFLYRIQGMDYVEFKVCAGLILMLKDVKDKSIEMSLLNVNTGQCIVKLTFKGVRSDIEFLEQFNQKVLIKISD